MKKTAALVFCVSVVLAGLLQSCREKPDPPSLSTAPVIHISARSAFGGGEIVSDGGSPVTERGVCWSISPGPTSSDPHSSDSTGIGIFTSILTGLSEDLVYYVRAYAINDAGTAYGPEIVFDNHWGNKGTFTDPREREAVYKWVRIGNQIWMAENMAYLPSVSPSSEGMGQSNTPRHYVSGYDGSTVFLGRSTDYFHTYGVLYNWPAAAASCPDGWHLPSDEEWKVLKGSVDSQYGVGDPEWELTRYQGLDAGSNLRAVSGWRLGDCQGTDLYGFTGLPGGYRKYDGGIFLIRDYGYFWTSTKTGDFYWSHYLLWGTSEAGREYFWPDYGFSVRCLRDD